MKNQRTLVNVLAAALLACTAGLATAADTQTLTVSATVIGTCKFSAATNTLAFGNIDPSLTTDKVLAANVIYKCTKNTASLGIAGTTGAMAMTSGANSLPFTLSIAGDTQAGKGFEPGATTELTAVVTGTIAVADFQNAAAGAYSKNVSLTISP
ncbi:MAG: spore coat protein U domain-containing protein [Pseudomonadota bacterium]|nr:spore coat protein U domain-containing protein [Pseudomonadota bacterium]